MLAIAQAMAALYGQISALWARDSGTLEFFTASDDAT
jgi:hypothetical protein